MSGLTTRRGTGVNKLQKARRTNRGRAAHTENQIVAYQIHTISMDLSEYGQEMSPRQRRQAQRFLLALRTVQRSRRGRRIHRCYQGAMITSAGFQATVNRVQL